MDGPEKEAVPSSCATNGTTTKIYYHLDDSATPYMSEVPVPSDRITLGDFKAVFTRKGYRYFCRRWDDQLKSEVKAELVRDQQRLQRSPVTGLFELFLLSPALPSSAVTATAAAVGGVGNADTLPRTRRKYGADTASSELPSLRHHNRHYAMDLQHHHHHHHLSALALSSIVAGGSSCSELMMLGGGPSAGAGGGQRVSMVTDGGGTTAASSGTNTMISKRAGENLAELYNSTSEDPYTRTTISSSGIFLRPKPEERSFASSTTDRPPNGRQKRRKARHRRPYVPSTISSASDESSSSLPRIEEVKLRLQEAQLGISVASQDGSIFIYNIHPDSAAEKCGRLEVGDQIVQVEDTKFEELSEKQALDMLRRLNSLKKTVTIYVAKRRPLNVGGSSSDKSDALSQFCETVQLDIGQWVESTKHSFVEPVLPFVDVRIGSSTKKCKNNEQIGTVSVAAAQVPTPTEEKGTSDEEQAAYMDRRNGVGPHFVSAVQKTKLQQQKDGVNSSKTATTTTTRTDEQHQQKQQQNANNNKNAVDPVLLQHHAAAAAPSVPLPLHAAMEPSVILRRMAHPRSGLNIRDRKWLKIPVPNSFIGDDMLDWLMCNVQGFKDRKCAKAFASTVLFNGLIKHVVNVSVFNEKCYYIFDDSILTERLHILRREAQQQKMDKAPAASDNGNGGNSSENKQQQPESTTEITYMSSPSSPFFGAVRPMVTQQKQQQTVMTTTTTTTSSNKMMGVGTGQPPPPQKIVVVNNPKYAQGPLQPSSATFANNGNLLPLRHFVNKLPAWPISPIPRECCELSEATNEYASMVQGEINCGAQFDANFDGFLAAPIVPSTNFVITKNSNNNNSIMAPLLPKSPALLSSVPSVPHQRQILKHK